MKKIFISVPMKGRTSEDINKSLQMMKGIGKAYFPNEEVVFIDNFVSCDIEDAQKRSMHCLGQAITKMADADTLIIPNSIWESNGCIVERDVAYRYGLRVIEVDLPIVCPDIIEARLKGQSECIGMVDEVRG